MNLLLALDNNSRLLAPDYQRLQGLRELLRNVLNENRAIGPHVGVGLHRVQGGNVLESLLVVLVVLDDDLQVQVMLAVLLRQSQGVFGVAGLPGISNINSHSPRTDNIRTIVFSPANIDGNVHIEVDISILGHDELVQLGAVFQLGVAVEEKGGVVL